MKFPLCAHYVKVIFKCYVKVRYSMLCAPRINAHAHNACPVLHVLTILMSEISRVRELAVQCLDGESSSQRTSSAERSEPERSGRSEPERSGRSVSVAQLPRVGSRCLYTSTSSRISALAERNCLFNFSKRSSSLSSSSRKTKKKRLEMWNHDFVCLAKTNRKKTPTAMERATLTSLGEIYKPPSLTSVGEIM